MLAFGYALSWTFATIGLWVGDPETAQAAAFPFLAILVFASSVFVSPRDSCRAGCISNDVPTGVGDRERRPWTDGRRTDG